MVKPAIMACGSVDEAALVLSRLELNFVELLREIQDFGLSK